MKKSIKICAFLISLLLLFCSVTSAYAVSYDDIYSKIDSTSQNLLSNPVPMVNPIRGEWVVIGLARSNKISDDFIDGYYKNAVSYVKEKNSAQLHRSKSTENSRMIIALTAIGKDPTNVAEYNLLEPLADFDYVKKQGLNGPIWALIACDTLQYEIPKNENVKTQTTREEIIDYIVSQECSDGGWDLEGIKADPDITGMALQALAPYYNKNESVKAAVDRALNVISDIYNTSHPLNNAESYAQLLTALSSLNIDCQSDERFNKNGSSLLDMMMLFSVEGGFEHNKNSGYNQMATEQCYYSLVSYFRFMKENTALFDMTDLLTKFDVNSDGATTITDATLIQKFIAESEKFTLLQQKLADANGDGKVNINDVTFIQKYLAV